MPLFIKKAHTNGKSYTTGFTGVFVNQLGLGKIPRGTALDPVGNKGGVQVAKDNYGYLEVIHSSELGLLDRLGHVDFYPNGGENQPCSCQNSKKKGFKPCDGINILRYNTADHAHTYSSYACMCAFDLDTYFMVWLLSSRFVLILCL